MRARLLAALAAAALTLSLSGCGSSEPDTSWEQPYAPVEVPDYADNPPDQDWGPRG